MNYYDSYIEYTGKFVDYAAINRSSLTFRNSKQQHIYRLRPNGVSMLLSGYFGQNNEGNHIFVGTTINGSSRDHTILAFKCDRGVFYKPFEEIKSLFFKRVINDDLTEFYNDLKAQYYRLMKYIINNKLTTQYYLTDVDPTYSQHNISKDELRSVYCYTAPKLSLANGISDETVDIIKNQSNNYANVIKHSADFSTPCFNDQLIDSFDNMKSVEAKIKIALLVGKSPIFIDYQSKKVSAYKYSSDDHGNIMVNKVYVGELISSDKYYYYPSGRLVKDITPAQLLINLLHLKG